MGVRIDIDKPQNPFEAEAFITTKRQFQEVFLPASRHQTPGKRSPYVTLFAVRCTRDIDFNSARTRSIQTSKDKIFIDYATDDEAILVGYFAKNLKDLSTYQQRVGERQVAYYAQSGIIVEFHSGRKKI